MSDKNFKGLNIVMLVLLVCGIAVGILGRALRATISEYTSGFFTGISIVFIVIGLVYIMWRFSKGDNPFKMR